MALMTEAVTSPEQVGRCAGGEVCLYTGHLIACLEFYLNVRARNHGVVAFENQSLVAAEHIGVRVRIGINDRISFGGGHIALVGCGAGAGAGPQAARMAPAAVTPDKLRKSRRLTLRLIMMVSFVWQSIEVYPVEHRSIRSWILAER